MDIRNLGQSGLRVSTIGLGCNNFGGRLDSRRHPQAVIHKALDLGITLFDTADVYGERGGSETLMGRVLGAERKRIVLATKFAHADGRRRREDRRLPPLHHEGGGGQPAPAADRLHRPVPDAPLDPHTPIEETLRALDDLIRQGKVRYIGCSNFPAWQVTEAPGRPHARPERVRFVPGRILAGVPRARGRTDAGGAQAGLRPAAVFPAGERAADRQVSPQRRLAGRHPPGRHAAPGGPLPDRAKLGDGRETRRFRRERAGARCWNSRSVGCWRRARSPASSPARRGRSRSSRTSRPAAGRCRRTRLQRSTGSPPDGLPKRSS